MPRTTPSTRIRCSSTGLRRLLARFAGAHDGSQAIEFALVLPIMVTMVMCCTELSRACDNYKKVTQLARTVADLTAQGDAADPIPATKMNDILSASGLVLRPFDSKGAKIVVSAVGVYSVSNALKPRICSSMATSNATARALGYASDLTVPDGYQTTGMRYVLAEVTMSYTPMLGAMLTNLLGAGNGQFTFSVKTPWPARGGTLQKSTYSEVRLPNGAACPAT